MNFRSTLACFLIWNMSFAFAETEDLRSAVKVGQAQQTMQGSVYVYGDQSLDVLAPIRVLGAVAKPGIHFVPPKTDLVTLISLAGGTTERAQMDEVSIKRTQNGKTVVLHVDLEKLVEEVDTVSPEMVSNDTVLVPVDQSWVSDNTLRTVSLVTGIASIFLSIVVGVSYMDR